MGPLKGKTIALTAERRAEEFATLLERRGAETIHVPAIHVLPLLDDSVLQEKTAGIIDEPPELVVISTGVGFRGWLDAAEGWGNRTELLAPRRGERSVGRGYEKCGPPPPKRPRKSPIISKPRESWA